MTGLEAISANNGWSIAALGISIVFTGLTILAFTIAQLHKVLDFLEGGGKSKQKIQKDVSEEPVCTLLPENIKEPARHFKLLVEHIGEPFPLPKLLEFAEKCGLDHPHSNLNKLILSEVIIPDYKGYYVFNKDVSY